MNNKKDEPIGLNELIYRVKDELLQEQEKSEPLFVVKEVELEISFAVERGLDGGINLQVIKYDAGKHWTETQKVKITLDLQKDIYREVLDLN